VRRRFSFTMNPLLVEMLEEPPAAHSLLAYVNDAIIR
jgi:hypothetical protein